MHLSGHIHPIHRPCPGEVRVRLQVKASKAGTRPERSEKPIAPFSSAEVTASFPLSDQVRDTPPPWPVMRILNMPSWVEGLTHPR